MQRTRTIGLTLLSVLSFSVIWPAAGAFAAAGTKAVRFGKLIDGTGKVVADAVVVVKGDRIVAVGAGDAAIPGDSEVVDLSAYTGIPGLIDAHTHMTYYWDKAPRNSALGAG
jgi:imidazolonepropionase-like amidohydrolase